MARHKVAVQNILYTSRGHQIFKLNRNQTEKKNLAKKTFYFFEKCLKMYNFAFKVGRAIITPPKKNLVKNIKMGIKKTQKIVA
jgi:hypothetical protein